MYAYVLDKNFVTLDIIDQYKSFIWTDRYNEYGDFEIYTSVKLTALEYLKTGNYLWREDSDYLMIIEDVEISTDTEVGNFLIVTGRSLESLLERRVIWNRTVFENTDFQTVIRTLLNDNVISPSVGDRKIPNFVFSSTSDSRITSIRVDRQYLGENLYDAISALCKEYDIGWKVQLSGENFVFQLYAGVDRSFGQNEIPYVVFSPKYENLISSNYLKSDRHVKNVARISGEGKEGSEEKFLTETGSGSGLDRKEIFVDATGESRTVYPEGEDEEGSPLPSYELSDEVYGAQIRQKGNEELAKTKISISFEGDVDTTRQFIYDRDFFIGDLVQVINEYDIEDVCRITEVVRTHDDNGEILTPTFTSKTSTE